MLHATQAGRRQPAAALCWVAWPLPDAADVSAASAAAAAAALLLLCVPNSLLLCVPNALLLCVPNTLLLLLLPLPRGSTTAGGCHSAPS